MLVASIPGYGVQKLKKNEYLVYKDNVSTTMNKKELKAFAKANDGYVKNTSSTAKKVAGGLVLAGGIATAVALHKNKVDFTKVLEDIKLKDIAGNAYAKAVTGVGKVKDAAVDAAGIVGEKASHGAKTLKKSVGNLYNKVAEFVVAAWTKVKNFVIGLFSKNKPEAKVAEKVPFGKKFGNAYNDLVDSAKNFGKNFKNLFIKSKAEPKSRTIFDTGLSAKLEKAKKEGIVELANNATINPSGNTHAQWRNELASVFGATNVH